MGVCCVICTSHERRARLLLEGKPCEWGAYLERITAYHYIVFNSASTLRAEWWRSEATVGGGGGRTLPSAGCAGAAPRPGRAIIALLASMCVSLLLERMSCAHVLG